jgi:ubiquitin fusion degradation protein 1
MCSAQSEELTNKLKHSNKILLPPSILYELNQQEELDTDIMFFKVTNAKLQYGLVCGVQEFSAPPGICHVPYHIMDTIGITEGNQVEIEKISPVQGSYMKLRPHKTAFIDLPDPKAILEKIMSSDYPVVTQGQTIELFHEGIKYLIDIVETKPAEVISIVNTDINIDFEQPLDYVEPVAPAPAAPPPAAPAPAAPAPAAPISPTRAERLKKMKATDKFTPFYGKGNRLGSV